MQDLKTGPSTNVFVCTDFSPQCQGTISIGSSPGTCTVTNTVVEGPPPTEILTIIKEIGVCDGSTTTCNTIQYLHQTLPLTLLKVQIQLQVHLQVKHLQELLLN